MKNLILTGFMGTGKSTVGRILARRLGFRYADLDALIVERAGLSINDIFARYGEPHFRALETGVIRDISSHEGAVVSTGGGAVISPVNRELLHTAGVVVNLYATVEEICERLREDCERPLLREGRSRERVSAMMAEREPFYADADLRIDTTGKTVEDVVAVIIKFLGTKG